MNYSLVVADRATNVKIVIVALLWAIAAMGVAIALH